MGENGTFVSCWWEYKLLYILKSNLAVYTKDKNTCSLLSSNSTFKHTEKKKNQTEGQMYKMYKDVCYNIVVAKKWKYFECPSTG